MSQDETFDMIVDEYVNAVIGGHPNREELERSLIARWPYEPSKVLAINRMVDVLTAIAREGCPVIADDRIRGIESRLEQAQS